jgi:hypothetical protein
MKKILIGLLQTTASPFIVILGYYIISTFKVPEAAMGFACFLGGLSIVVNFVIGCLLIVKGYQESGAFKGWG